MPIRITGAIILTTALVAVGCNSGSGVMFADMRWQVQFPAGGGTSCTGTVPSREILGDDDEDNQADPGNPIVIDCAAQKGGGFLRFDLAGFQPDYSIEVRGVVVDVNGGDNISAGCEVEVTETVGVSGDFVFIGSCDPDPAANAPCSVSAEITKVSGDDSVRLFVSCVDIEQDGNSSCIRDLSLGGAISPDAPAELEVRNCPGQ